LAGIILGVLALILAATPLHAWAEARTPPSDLAQTLRSDDYRRLQAVYVMGGGETLFEAYFNGADSEHRVDARSVGKSITAMAVGMAIAEGALPGVDWTLGEAFEAHPAMATAEPERRAITVRQLLSMSSPLDCDDWRDSPGNEERMYRATDWTGFALSIPLADDFNIDQFGSRRFSYCTAGVFLLGRIVENATGEPFEAYVQERLFEPLGIDGAVWRRSPMGEAQSGGQLALRARDFARLGQLAMDGGVWGGRQLYPREWNREMLRPVRQATPLDGYAYLWWVRQFHGEDGAYVGFYMSGNGGNKVVLFPELNAVVVVLSENYNRADMHDLTTRLIERRILPWLE
jgi:CubicO group peptidase (beta-lactamase class C family)